MKKILVTGADGFIGSHLVEYLHAKGYEIRALSLYNSFNNWGWLEQVDCLNEIEVVTGNISDPFFCNEITKEIDTIFHLAALIAIPYSYVAPASYVDVNINGTVNMCKAAMENGCRRFIHTSTSEVYGTAQYVPIDELHPLRPQSPYSASKISADAMAMSFYNSFELPLTTVRPFNTYGPRQSARAVIPTIITQIASGIKEIKLGDLSPTRDFNYVYDTCNGFYQLAQCNDAIGKVVNIGSNYEISVKDTLNKIKKLMSSDVKFITDEQRIRPQKSEVKRLWCDNTLINELTGFKPQFTIDEGLSKTIEWFKDSKNLRFYKPNIYNI